MRIIGWLFSTFLEAMIVGSLVWILAKLFGNDPSYWGWMRVWVPVHMVIDGIIAFFKSAGDEFGGNSSSSGSNPYTFRPPWT